MKYYVNGFMFNEEGTKVALIRKNRPEWQKGCLNGIGGKINDEETPIEAMNREFEEEAGGKGLDWFQYCVLDGEGWSVYFFTTRGDLSTLETKTDEGDIEIHDVHLIQYEMIIKNLLWLVPMALLRETTAEVYQF